VDNAGHILVVVDHAHGVAQTDGQHLVMHGQPFTKVMARRAGLPREQLDLLRRTGAVRRVLRDVYLDAAVPDDVVSRSAAVALVLPDGAAIGRRTAAWLLGVDAWPDVAPQRSRPVECLVPRGRQPVRRPGVRCFAADLTPEDVVTVGSVLATTPLRTAVDALRWLRPHHGLGTADALAHLKLVDPAQVLDEVDRWRKYPGIAQARYLAHLIEPATESFGESATRLRIIDAGLPRPIVQVEILGPDGVPLWRLDLGWPDHRKAVEYDGEKYHSRDHDRNHDRARREAIERGFGWEIYVARKEHVYGKDVSLEVAAAYMLGVQPVTPRRKW